MESQETATKEVHTVQPKHSSLFSRRNIIILVVVLVIIAIVWFMRSGDAVAPDTASSTAPVIASDGAADLTDEEIQQVQAQVRNFLELPQETPLARRLDGGQFPDTNPGDVLLIYPSVQQAVIFSPERNKLVNVGFIQFAIQQ